MDHSERKRRIGIDFDNTIISYQQAFLETAREYRLLPEHFIGAKQAVRDQIRLLPDGEREWMRLQGFVYGKGIGKAAPFDGVAEFLRRCHKQGDMVFIVSHKTEFGHFDTSGVNLRQAARDWIKTQGFLHHDEYGLSLENVYFEETRAAKLDRIGALECTHFIDDLEEVLCDPTFPPQVKRILFTDGTRPERRLPYTICLTWLDIADVVFNEHL
jgi:hypothetical protein